MDVHRVLGSKRAIVTGGTGGLGSAIALALAQAGAGVAICGRNSETAAATSRRLETQSGSRVFPVQLDLLEAGAAARAVNETVATLGGLDILVTSAGAPADGRFETVSPSGWQDSFAVKFFGTVDVVRAALPHMKAAGGGVMVALSGLFGREPVPGNIVSGTINAAIENFMKALAADVASYGIRALTLCPGPFYTSRIENILKRRANDTGQDYEGLLQNEQRAVPVGRFGRPEEFARLVVTVVSDESSFLTGTTITIDGGVRRSV